MKTIPFGNTGETVSEFCLGTMYFGSRLEEKESRRLLDWYRDRQGNFIDTANNYAHWVPGCEGTESEQLLGRWLAERGERSKIFLATKIGFDKKGEGAGLSRAQVVSNCEASLRYLQTDYIDLLYAHMDDRKVPQEETLEAFTQLKKQGKVRCIGASNHEWDRLASGRKLSEERSLASYCCLQNRHSYLEINPGTDTSPQVLLNPRAIEACGRQGLQLLAYSPLLQGAYCLPRRPLPEGYRSEANENRMTTLFRIAKEKGATPNQVVIAWMRRKRIIPLMTGERIAHLEENFQAADLRLSREEAAALDG